MAQKKKNTRLTIPTGKAAFPYLNRPDTQFNTDGEWKVDLIMSKEEANDFLAKVDEEVDAHFNNVYNEASAKKKKKLVKHYPYEDVLDDETEEPTGEVKIKTKMKAKIKTKDDEEIELAPQLFDKKGNPLDREKDIIRMNSLIRAAVELRPYTMDSTGMTGVTLQLKAVQVRQFAEGTSAESFGFDVEEGDFSDNGEQDEAEGEKGNGTDDDDDSEGDF